MEDRNGDHRWEFFTRGAAQVLAGAGTRKLSALASLKNAVLKEEQRLIKDRPKIVVAMPTYNDNTAEAGTWAAFMGGGTNNLDQEVVIRYRLRNSLLARCFNHCWAEAVTMAEQGKATHFAMLHTDVVPAPLWIDTLYNELVRLDADIVSAVIPIKTQEGLTSTALDSSDRWNPHRLTMKEVMQLPETFGADDVTQAGLNPGGGKLLVNTGCWICDLRKPWVGKTDDAGEMLCHFTINDRVRREGDRWTVEVEPEDWYFSRSIYKASPDARIFATRQLHVEHVGTMNWINDAAWGRLERDEDWYDRHGKTEAPAAEETIVPPEPELAPAGIA